MRLCPIRDVTDRGTTTQQTYKERTMDILAHTLPLAAAGYSLLYLLGGGGIIGAGVIFVVAKLLGK